MLPVLRDFSAGYELIDLVVTRGGRPEPRVQQSLYEALATRGPDREPVVFRDAPSGTHFTVSPASDVPTDVIELPDDIYETVDPWPEPSQETFHVAQPQYASQLVWLAQTRQLPLETAPEQPLRSD